MSALEDHPLAASSLRALKAFASSVPPTLTLVVGSGDLAPLAASYLGNLLVRPDARTADVHIATPSSDRWTIEELDELVIRPARLVPLDRTVIVVCAADHMDTACAEHLLKVVEEPHAGCSFLFAAESAAGILPTLRSRTGAVLELAQPSAAEHIRLLLDAGATRDAASRAVSLVPDLHALCLKAALDEDVLNRCAVFELSLFSQTPSETASTTALTLESLAAISDPLASVASQPDGASPGKKAPDTVVRARTRVLLRRLIARWREELRAALSNQDLDHRGFSSIERAAVVLDEADALLDAYATVRNVLTFTLVSCAALSV